MSGVFVQRLGAPKRLARRFLVYSMVGGFAALALAGLAAAWVTGRSIEHGNWVNHTYDVELAIVRTQVLTERAENARRGYLITGMQSYLDKERAVAARIMPALGTLRQLIGDNPRQIARVDALRSRVADIAARQEISIALVQKGRRDEAQSGFTADAMSRRMTAIRSILRAMVDEERRLLAQRDAALNGSLRTFYIILIIAGILIVLLAAVSLATVMRYTRDLGLARDRLQSINADLEGAVTERTVDLTRANEEIQRFAYIVSHDLRSPLVNVMGFTAELDGANAALSGLVDAAEQHAPSILTDDARLAAREDIPEAINFIRSSTQKMDRLINAILRLSREGRRTLNPEPLSLDAIAGTVRDSVRHIADEKGAQIIIKPNLPSLVSDRLAVEQILSNLVENAIKYLSTDRPGRIEVSGRMQGDLRLIEVADNGRGIAEADRDRVFDLFRRSGVQDQPGEGIGLAHVRALVHRLGGTIDLSSTLGEGSVFRVTLPATPPETGPTP